FFRFDVFGQLSGQCFEFVLVHLLTHEGILLKKLLIRGRLHNWIYRLLFVTFPFGIQGITVMVT
ncbi:hypothetical protein, partial [Aeromonas sp.]|uniref:hypothetical protein n=1 Tax=Aeromonas sp. TaxID=647 RepID=UPI0025901CAE